jgi:hypothetical protein
LKGNAIVMNKKDFEQGMSHADALKKDVGIEKMTPAAMAKLTENLVLVYLALRGAGYRTHRSSDRPYCSTSAMLKRCLISEISIENYFLSFITMAQK